MNYLRLIYAVGLLVIFHYKLEAQVNSVFGRFSTSHAKACVPYTIHLQETPGLETIGKTYLYEPGAPETLELFYTYTQPGTYAIVQLLAEDISPKTDTLFITLYNPELPVFEVIPCEDGASIFFEKTIYDSYQILSESDTLTWDRFDTPLIINNAGEITIRGLIDLSANNCGITSTSIRFQPFSYEIEHTSPGFIYACDLEASLQLDFNTLLPSLVSIQITSDTLQSPDEIYWGIVSDSMLTFNELKFEADALSLCYRINQIQPCNGQIMIGAWQCTSREILNQPIRQAYATVSNEEIIFHYQATVNGLMKLDQFFNGTFREIDANITDGFRFRNTNFNREQLFRLTFSPDCLGNDVSFDISPATIQLTKKNPNQYNYIINPPVTFPTETFRTTDIRISGMAAERILSRNSLDGTLFLQSNEGLQQLVEAYFTFQNTEIFTNKVKLTYESVVYVPTAFTPNGDGLNDEITFLGLSSLEFSLWIFNRWGSLVHFQNEGTPSWDGTDRNGTVQSGIYTYKIEFGDLEGNIATQLGSFVLIK